MTDIFVSYKAEDRARVKSLVNALVAEGLTVWWDVHIEGGAGWRETIQAKLDEAACVVVVWSALSVTGAGRFVQDEAARADRRGVLLPVAIDAVEAPLGFGGHHVISLVGWRGARRDPRYLKLLENVQAITARGGGSPRAPTVASAPQRRAGLKALSAMAAIALVAGAGGVLAVFPAVTCATTGLRCAANRHEARAPPANSLAVLPFANLGGDPAQEYFSEGLAEELTSALARLGSIQVTGRTSSLKFKDSKDDSATIGAKLGVAYLLDGSVRRDGAVVRVSAQLVDTKSGFEHWSETYDRAAGKTLAVQSGIAKAVAEALKVQLLGADIVAISRGGTSDAKAYDDYLRGKSLFDAGGGESSYRAALAKFDSAIAADPKFAAAHAVRARTLLAIANRFAVPAQARSLYDAALASARRAVVLAPDLAETQTTLATSLLDASLDVPAAKAAYARAMSTGSGDADVLLGYGLFRCRIGDTKSGLVALERGVTLDPLNPRAFLALGYGLIAARKYPQAIAAMRRTLELNRNAGNAHAAIGDALVLEGRLIEAKSEYALEPESWARLTGQAIVLHHLRDVRGADTALTALIADGGDSGAYQEARINAQWGDRDRAIAALDAAFRSGDSGLLWMKSDPFMDPLRADPRFAARLTRLHIDG